MSPKYPPPIDVSVRCMRTNPELLAVAERHARETGTGVDRLLAEAANRCRGLAYTRAVTVRPSLRVLQGGVLSRDIGGHPPGAVRVSAG